MDLAIDQIKALRTANVTCVADLVHNVRNVAAVKYVGRAARAVAEGRDQRTVTDAAETSAVIDRAEAYAMAWR